MTAKTPGSPSTAHGVVVAAEGFVEEQLTYAFHRLREDGLSVGFATATGAAVEGEHGMVIEDAGYVGDTTDRSQVRVVVVPGARGMATGLPAEFTEWLGASLHSADVFACLGAGVRVLVHLDALDGRLVAGPDALRAEIERAGGRLTDERVTVDGEVVTGRDTASLPFFMAAARNAQAIPQDPDRVVRRRPYQDRAAWEAEPTD